jgi:predicted nuclease of predicted toxin-antitoxin system
MNAGDVGLLTDENVSPKVVAHLRMIGMDVLDVKEQGWQGAEDEKLLDIAYQEKRFVFTQDSPGIATHLTRMG